MILGQGLVGLLTTALAKAIGAGPIICSDFDDNRLALARSLGADCAVNTASSHQALTQALSDYDLATIPVVFEATGARRTLEQAVELLAEQGRLMMLSQGDGETLPNIAQGLMMKGATLIGGYVNSKPYALFRSDLKIKQRWPPQYDGDVNKTESHQYNTSLDDITTFLKLISLNRIDLAPLITHRFQWQDLPKAYQQVTARDASLVGGVIDWSNP
ncbi:zinc-binding dehydrogenase [Halioxenophilus aromaticivorans]|uniref:Alcohol dehydrogenase-like C-terminal domain-containing protein n=1 Tax=Halioxenophilus aromaticivorans TaxID=1306992 RepID=A0AAV3U7R9_9ALTE